MVRKRKSKKLNILFLLKNFIYYLVIVLVFFGIFIKKNFNNVSFEQLLFTLSNPEGGNFDIVYKGIFFVLGFASLVFLIFFLINYFIRKERLSAIIRINVKGKRVFKFDLFKETYVRQIIIFCVIVFIGLSIPSNMVGMKTYVKAQKANTEFFEEYYVDPSKTAVTFEEKKNLIYIYVESLETSSFSIENGGQFEESYIPNLEKIALDNISFSHNSKLGGFTQLNNTGWTMAALVAQTSGIPFKVNVAGNDYNPEKSLPGAYNIGQVLEDNGYKNYFMMGSDGDFGGRKKYFVQHGNYQIFDYYYAIDDGFIDSNYFVWWGYEDRKLFSYAQEKLLEISKNDEPFNFTMLTVDTHFVDGYVDDSCDLKFDNAYANAFYCSDSKIYNFVEWIKQQDFYENTTIVIVGDHLTMQEGFYPNNDTNSRYVYNAFINSSVDTNDTKNREFSHFDIYPTTLAAMGAKIDGNKLGLGVNLFSNEKTLVEKLGFDKVNESILGKSKYYNEYILGEIIEENESISSEDE